MAKKTEKQTVAENILELERLLKRVLRKSFKDNTLDYTVQYSVSSLQPGKIKYAFMINGMKKEIQPITLSFDSFEECKAVLEGLLTEVNTAKLEEMFHIGRINVYKHAITSHEERLKQMEEGDEDDGIVMERV